MSRLQANLLLLAAAAGGKMNMKDAIREAAARPRNRNTPAANGIVGCRYDYCVDPLDFCVIWDRIAACPVVVDDDILAFATTQEAIAVIRQLERTATEQNMTENAFPTPQSKQQS